ncbi:uncharacterized protein LOC116417118 [Nasonia vitripennis]|uniref:RNase H type-1 domain-containing protein n=1 Tax=Nasonia vitripennis TaxID=7425 RepID=A0A7M7QBQ2_NASVI|nr:uncharacterized protein LOC116417118 [Nasonia vitripennis]
MLQKVEYRYKLKKVNWETFYDILEEHKHYFNSLEFTNSDIISKYNNFVEFIDKTIIDSYSKDDDKPISTSNIRLRNNCSSSNPQCIWWNEECSKAIRLRKNAQLSIKHRFTIEQFIEVKKTEALVRKTLKEEKMKSVRTFCESVNPRTNIRKFWNKIKMYKNGINRIQNSTGNKKQENSIKDTIESLCSSKMNVDRTLRNINGMEEQEHDSFLDFPFSFEELQFCLNNTNTKSSPGIDKIDYEIISNLPEFYQRILLELYNDIFHCKVFPEDWKSYLVKFIPKGTSDKVRPISLASCMLKVMERLVKERLEWWCETNGFLAQSQMGFRKDDISIYNKESNLSVEEKTRKLETEASRIVLFLRERGLEIAPDKCVLVIFHDSNYNYYKDIQISINNISVGTSEHVKFLGFAIWSEDQDFNSAFKILDKASIYTAECKALINVIDKITVERECEFLVFSDSQSALLALANNKNRCSPLIAELRQKLASRAEENVKIKLVWIPAHAGIKGNETVDKMAKNAAIDGKLLNDPIPYSDFFANIKETCKKENQDIITNLGKKKGIFYFENFGDIEGEFIDNIECKI